MSVASVKFDEMSPQYRETDLNYINKVESRTGTLDFHLVKSDG